MKKIICVFHEADLDGHCSAAIIKYHYVFVELIPMNHGWSFPWEKITRDAKVYMVDFCLPTREEMIRLNEMCDLRWIDHHKTAIEKMEGVEIFGFRDTDFSGCELTWKYINTDVEMPKGVKYLGRYDVWDHSDPDTLAFQRGSKTFITDVMNEASEEYWNKVIKRSRLDKIIAIGKKEIERIDYLNEEYCKKYAFETFLDGYKVIACNKLEGSSLLFKSVYDPAKYDIMLTFGYRDKQWTVSLYSTTIDVSEIAKAHGGGGHKGAAGFPCKELPFELR